jgi:uncharacterized damage-inducible protein DinB
MVSMLSQSTGPATGSPMAEAGILWEQVRDCILRAAEEVPEAMYSYRPVAGVRTFGELIGHIAGAQNTFCALALGEKPPREDAIETAHLTKASLLQALRESNAYCARAYAQDASALTAPAAAFGGKRTRSYMLMLNVAHDNEHYGSIVTYMRMNGMVPPSSQPSR